MQEKNKQRWFALWKRIDAETASYKTYNDLIARYEEPHRFYHTLSHIEKCLAEFEEISHLASDPDAVEMAIWYHDAIYDTRANDNEEKSAELAIKSLEDAPLPFTRQVGILIIATKHDVPPTDNDAKLVTDIDLASLGAQDETFDENNRLIRKEYEWVPEELFKVGRSKLLKFLIDRRERPHIYSTQFFRDEYETQARKNIARAIAQLSK